MYKKSKNHPLAERSALMSGDRLQAYYSVASSSRRGSVLLTNSKLLEVHNNEARYEKMKIICNSTYSTFSGNFLDSIGHF